MSDPDASIDRELIVVGVDGSDPSKQALRWASRQAKLTGAVVEAVTAWAPVTVFGALPPVGVERDFEAEARETLDMAVADVVDQGPQVEIRTATVQGHPASVLVEASQSADLLVVGSHGHGAFAGMLLGSVSLHCVSQATCPVVVVRTRRDTDARPPNRP